MRACLLLQAPPFAASPRFRRREEVDRQDSAAGRVGSRRCRIGSAGPGATPVRNRRNDRRTLPCWRRGRWPGASLGSKLDKARPLLAASGPIPDIRHRRTVRQGCAINGTGSRWEPAGETVPTDHGFPATRRNVSIRASRGFIWEVSDEQAPLGPSFILRCGRPRRSCGTARSGLCAAGDTDRRRLVARQVG